MSYTILKPKEIWSQSGDIYKAFLIFFNLLRNNFSHKTTSSYI